MTRAAIPFASDNEEIVASDKEEIDQLECRSDLLPISQGHGIHSFSDALDPFFTPRSFQ